MFKSNVFKHSLVIVLLKNKYFIFIKLLSNISKYHIDLLKTFLYKFMKHSWYFKLIHDFNDVNLSRGVYYFY